MNADAHGYSGLAELSTERRIWEWLEPAGKPDPRWGKGGVQGTFAAGPKSMICRAAVPFTRDISCTKYRRRAAKHASYQAWAESRSAGCCWIHCVKSRRLGGGVAASEGTVATVGS